MAYRMWLTRLEDLRGLSKHYVNVFDKYELDANGELLTEVSMNYTEVEFMTYNQAIAWFREIKNISELDYVRS